MDTEAQIRQIFTQYEHGVAYKNGIGKRGLYQQNRINERFYAGDQWYGAHCGDSRPLVRHNLIKRIGDYKMAMIGSSPVSVQFCADGIAATSQMQEEVRRRREAFSAGDAGALICDSDTEINLVMSALSDYFKVTAERVRLPLLAQEALKKAYQTGTGILYTYWDGRVRTGLYADRARTQPILGDIACEVLDVENVYFGDPTEPEVQKQPYILIARRLSVEEAKREARQNRRPAQEIAAICPDRDCTHMAGDRAADEPENSGKVTVLTRLWKEWDEEGGDYTMRAVTVCRGAVLRPEWELAIRLYPLTVFRWETRAGCAYGDSEITFLIPNQIAVNRMLTAGVWAVMNMGMPIMVVNGDVVTGPVSNDPGQVLKVYGGSEDVARAVRYVEPPAFSAGLDRTVERLIDDTLTQSGANDAALGDMAPNNTSAILAVREAATLPLQLLKNRYYAFYEELARVWAEFWIRQYGVRALKIRDESGTWYLPFDGRKYADLLIRVQVDVGASTIWSESQTAATLDNLLDKGVLSVSQYLKRLPRGLVPDLQGLQREAEISAAESGGAIGKEAL